MIDIDLRAADFEAELDKVRRLNKEKKEKRLQERDAVKNALINGLILEAYLQELKALSDDDLAYKQDGDEVDN